MAFVVERERLGHTVVLGPFMVIQLTAGASAGSWVLADYAESAVYKHLTQFIVRTAIEVRFVALLTREQLHEN